MAEASGMTVSGGMEVSCSAVMRRTGAVMSPSLSRRSVVPRASQQAGVTLVGGVEELLTERVDVGEVGQEPALQGGVGDGLGAFGADGGGSVGPHLGVVGRAGRRAEQCEAVEAVGCVLGEPEADRAAERDADVRRLVDAEGVEEFEYVAAEVVDRVRPGRRLGLAVAAVVERDHPEPLRQHADLWRPHRVRRPERGPEQNHGRVVGTGLRIVESHRPTLRTLLLSAE